MMPIPAQAEVAHQDAQQAEADGQRDRGAPRLTRSGAPDRRYGAASRSSRSPGIVEPRKRVASSSEPFEPEPKEAPSAPHPPVELARRALHPDEFDSYTEVKLEQVETKWPLFQAQVVYLGTHPKKSISIKGTIITETLELPTGALQRLDYVVPTDGSHIYEFWTTDTRGRRMPTYEPTVCGCGHREDQHPLDPTKECGVPGLVLRGPMAGQTLPCDCKLFSPRGRLMPLTTRDESIRGRPMQFVQHPAHLRFFFRHKENGAPAFKVRILPEERSRWLEWLMRVERTEAKISEFTESTQVEDGSGWYVHANPTRGEG